MKLFLGFCLYDSCSRGHVFRHPDVASHGGSASDGDAAQDGGVAIDDDVVLQYRVAGDALHGIAVGIEGEALGTEGDALVELHVVADDACLSDDHSRAVVDGEVCAYACAGMYVDAGLAVRHLGDDARQEGDASRQQGVGHAVVQYGPYGWVAADDFAMALRRRVAVVGGLHVGGKHLAQSGQLGNEHRGAVGGAQAQGADVLTRVVEAEGGEYLLRHDAVKLFHHDARMVLEGAAVDVRDAEVAGEYEVAGQFHRPAQGLGRGQGVAVAMAV